MARRSIVAIGCALLAQCVAPATRQDVVPVAARPAAGPTVADAVATRPALTQLARAVAAADLAGALAGPGPLTVFAPTDEAFGRLAPATVAALFRPENKAALTKLVRLHVVAGAWSGSELARRVAAGGGQATLTSLAGEPLALSLTDTAITLTDSLGDKSYVEVADLNQANGVVHVVNGVLIPRIN